MAGQFEVTTEIERPIEEVFAFLADGENDPRFSPRVERIAKVTDGPVGVGTVYESTVKDAGVRTRREFRITEFDPPSRIRWTEISENLVRTEEGGYDLEKAGEGITRVRLFNALTGEGVGKLMAGTALNAARADAEDFGRRIKEAVEGGT
ncbi:SRPBCC family protein [Streptomyces marispadix]|uniref:SRPBCC family protein n=1 Tax=Streptomyces marispadix TaxID=2922868 RepID=A0ABS9SRJ2_9ACTN|nr:SRPBCC family protein [Streptomyces marispadix]MCH6158899.1 SRPBCC family protein [Streptomyces marispadix]